MGRALSDLACSGWGVGWLRPSGRGMDGLVGVCGIPPLGPLGLLAGWYERCMSGKVPDRDVGGYTLYSEVGVAELE
jgi:hypothetical protein